MVFRFRACSSGHMRRPTVGRGRQAGVTPNLLIAHLEKIAPPLLQFSYVSLVPVDAKGAEVCNVLQHPLTDTGTAVRCTGVRQVPPKVDGSI